MALHIKYSSYDSREFPPENLLLHAFVSSLPVILASDNRRIVKLLSHVDSWQNMYKNRENILKEIALSEDRTPTIAEKCLSDNR